MTEEMLEILIGKFLDSEITPGERRLLDDELERNVESRRLFEAFERMHARMRTVLGAATQGGGSATEVLERAWQQHGGRMARRRFAGWRRFAAGVAAGLAIGAGAFALMARKQAPDTTMDPEVLARVDENDESTMPDGPAAWDLTTGAPGDVIRQVDFYNFTDDSGGQWLMEGLREKRIQPAMYYQDL